MAYIYVSEDGISHRIDACSTCVPTTAEPVEVAERYHMHTACSSVAEICEWHTISTLNLLVLSSLEVTIPVPSTSITAPAGYSGNSEVSEMSRLASWKTPSMLAESSDSSLLLPPDCHTDILCQ